MIVNFDSIWSQFLLDVIRTTTHVIVYLLPIYLCLLTSYLLHCLTCKLWQGYYHSQIVSLFVHLGLCSSGSLYIPFITMWPWLCPLFPLLWCSITLSSWGKHWCQATVMTFWLSVFMWWMRWKCTTTAKWGLGGSGMLPNCLTIFSMDGSKEWQTTKQMNIYNQCK